MKQAKKEKVSEGKSMKKIQKITYGQRRGMRHLHVGVRL
jgi:hypothetical protein